MAYPRPQLQREQWTALDGQWRFLFDPERHDQEAPQVLGQGFRGG